MGRIYYVTPVTQNPGGGITILDIVSGATHGFRLKWVNVTSADVAGATNVLVAINRITGAGTPTGAVTPSVTVKGDTAFTGLCGYKDTVEPTGKTAIAQKRWVTITECDFNFEGREPSFAAGAGDGFAVTLGADSGANTFVTVCIEEF